MRNKDICMYIHTGGGTLHREDLNGGKYIHTQKAVGHKEWLVYI